MKKNIVLTIAILFVTLFVLSSFSTSKGVSLSHYKIADNTYTYSVPNKEDAIPVAASIAVPTFNLFLGKTYIGFKEALGFKESRGNYAIINKFGYLGKYQFAKATLSMIGIHNSTEFMKDSKLQERAFAAHTSRNKWILRRDIKRFSGVYINGIKVTESGILAAAHLAGAGNVKKYLRSYGVYHFEDAFGTTIGYYLKKFSGYDTSYIKANKKARVI